MKLGTFITPTVKQQMRVIANRTWTPKKEISHATEVPKTSPRRQSKGRWV